MNSVTFSKPADEGVSRDTFYRHKEAVDEGGVDALLEKNRQVTNRRNRVEAHIEAAMVKYASDEPALGQVCGKSPFLLLYKI